MIKNACEGNYKRNGLSKSLFGKISNFCFKKIQNRNFNEVTATKNMSDISKKTAGRLRPPKGSKIYLVKPLFGRIVIYYFAQYPI